MSMTASSEWKGGSGWRGENGWGSSSASCQAEVFFFVTSPGQWLNSRFWTRNWLKRNKLWFVSLKNVVCKLGKFEIWTLSLQINKASNLITCHLNHRKVCFFSTKISSKVYSSFHYLHSSLSNQCPISTFIHCNSDKSKRSTKNEVKCKFMQ